MSFPLGKGVRIFHALPNQVADVRRRYRRPILAVLLLAAAVAAPCAAAAPKQRAVVPKPLYDAAVAAPSAPFAVIVEAARGQRSGDVEAAVKAESRDTPGNARGFGRAFRTVAAVSAELTGKQIVHLAARPGILAITRDAAMRASVLDPPANATAPAIVGTASVGSVLTASAGTWTGTAPLDTTFEWERCAGAVPLCAPIAGATAAAYTATDADVGSTLAVAVTATNAAGAARAESPQTAVVVAAVAAPGPSLSAAPAVTGVAETGVALAADDGLWTGTGAITIARVWQRCAATGDACVDVAGATAPTYTLGDADLGSTIRIAVTATDATGSATAVSRPTGVVAAPAPVAPPPAPAPVAPAPPSNIQIWPYAVRAHFIWGTRAPAIAVIDSGVDPSTPGLENSVAAQVTMTTQVQQPVPDGYGHGTFVAGIAAGHGDGHAGAAPGAPIVSLDVMNDDGRALTSDVIAAADWILAHKNEYGIRVANLSMLASVPSSILYDPLDQAVEKLWLNGIVVVTAAGNYAVDGVETQVPYAPANDPFVISVGALDVNQTLVPQDDFAAPWSAYGHTADGFTKPELSAPGRYMVAAVPTASTLYTTRADRIVAPGYLQLSGTSFAAPVVAGVAAQLLTRHPAWTPDQVKGALMRSAVHLASTAPRSGGVGEIDAPSAAVLDAPPNPNLALAPFVVPDPAGSGLSVFDAAAWRAVAVANPAWAAESWGTESWGTESWGTESWGTAYWNSSAFASESWGTESWGTESWGTVVPDNAGGEPLGNANRP